MNILIVTSKDHMYANVVLSALARSFVLRFSKVWVIEQSSLIPEKSHWFGLWKYLRISGIQYVYWQIVKQYWFLWHRWIAKRLDDTKSVFFPYWLLQGSLTWRRETVNGVRRDEIVQRIQAFHPDSIISIYSKEILSQKILSIPSRGAVNVHPAILPYNRGVSPIFWCMVKGERSSGATLHCMSPTIDGGTIISQRSFLLRPYRTEHEVYMKSASLSGSMLIAWFRNGCPMPPKQQDIHSHMGYNSLPTKQAVSIFFKRGYRFL